MERNVVTLETARKLRAAGFPQNTQAAWTSFHDGTWTVIPKYYWIPGANAGLAAATAQEIADELPKVIEGQFDTLGLAIWPGADRWEASYMSANEDGKRGVGDTMAEALAALWLRLREAKQ
jgi:hypothetical protein